MLDWLGQRHEPRSHWGVLPRGTTRRGERCRGVANAPLRARVVEVERTTLRSHREREVGERDAPRSHQPKSESSYSFFMLALTSANAHCDTDVGCHPPGDREKLSGLVVGAEQEGRFVKGACEDLRGARAGASTAEYSCYPGSSSRGKSLSRIILNVATHRCGNVAPVRGNVANPVDHGALSTKLAPSKREQYGLSKHGGMHLP